MHSQFVNSLLIMCLLSVPYSSRACTSFVVKKDNQILLAKNLDWEISNGIILVNKKGIFKTAYCDGHKKLSWTSRYGSVTFNQFGKEFPLGGMNEKGLVIEELNSWGQTPGSDSKYQLNEFQWTQYCLDNFAYVGELLDGIDSIVIVPLFINLHYLATDSHGNSAIVEFYNGKAYTYSGPGLPYPVLSNNHYENSLGYLGNFLGFGGEMEVWPDNSSNGRFVKAASMLESGKQRDNIEDVAFEILDSVRQDDTQWSIVYNISTRSIHYKTKENTAVRTIELNDLDFTCKTPVLFVDINNVNNESGESSFRKFSKADNKQLLIDVFQKYDFHNPGEVSISVFLNLAGYGNSVRCSR